MLTMHPSGHHDRFHHRAMPRPRVISSPHNPCSLGTSRIALAAGAEDHGRTRELAMAIEKLVFAQQQISKYLDPNVTEQIFSGEFAANLTHWRTKLTMCFTDIKDFTTFTTPLTRKT